MKIIIKALPELAVVARLTDVDRVGMTSSSSLISLILILPLKGVGDPGKEKGCCRYSEIEIVFQRPTLIFAPGVDIWVLRYLHKVFKFFKILGFTDFVMFSLVSLS